MSDPDSRQTPFEYIFEQQVRASKADRFHAFSDRLRVLASRQPGFLDQERRLVKQDGEVMHFQTALKFDTAGHCITWLDNPERRRLLNQEEEEAGFAFKGHGNWEGYSRWLSRKLTTEPSKWKVNLLVLLTLYPMAMLLGPVLHVAMKGFSSPAVMLAANALCVAATSYILVPFASRFYLGWLEGRPGAGNRMLAPLSLFALLLALLALFQWLPASFWG